MPTVASIPSPRSGVVDIGPLHIHMYGLMLLVAIAACVWLTGVRWTRLGGDWDLVLRVAVWGVAFGIVGARVYHDITSWDEVPDHWWGPFAVWQGGLGVWGGILFGCIAGAVVIHRSGESVRLFADAVAPGLLIAQGIGRWGNWFNQELYGKPTNLPWGLEIDERHRLPQYVASDTFHPTFLYEFIYDLAMARRADPDRLAVPDQAARPLRALRRLLHVRAHVRGAVAGRSRRTTSPESG